MAVSNSTICSAKVRAGFRNSLRRARENMGRSCHPKDATRSSRLIRVRVSSWSKLFLGGGPHVQHYFKITEAGFGHLKASLTKIPAQQWKGVCISVFVDFLGTHQTNTRHEFQQSIRPCCGRGENHLSAGF